MENISVKLFLSHKKCYGKLIYYLCSRVTRLERNDLREMPLNFYDYVSESTIDTKSKTFIKYYRKLAYAISNLKRCILFFGNNTNIVFNNEKTISV